MKEQLESLCKHPHRFHGTEEEQTEMVSRMKSMLAQDRISINDLMGISRGFDLNLKSMLMMACTSYRIIFEDTIRFVIKEKPDLSLPEFGFEEFRNALGKRISNDAILIAMKSGCFNMDSFNSFCEWGIFNHNGSFCYDPVRKKRTVQSQSD